MANIRSIFFNRLYPDFWFLHMVVHNAFWDSLSPLAARMPRVVREYEILRIAATIPGVDASASADSARQEVLKWAQRRSGGRLPDEAWTRQSFEYFSGGRNSLGVRLNNDESDIWAMRADDPDKDVPGRIWTTEVVIGNLKDQPARFSARLLVSTSETDLLIQPHTPGLVQQVAENCGLLRGTYDITPNPWLINTESDLENLVDVLLDKDRRQPVFVLTVPENARVGTHKS